MSKILLKCIIHLTLNNASVLNALSKAVPPAETATDIISYEDIDKEMYQYFIGKRIKGKVSVWSMIEKCNLKMFWIQGKSITTKIGEKEWFS